MTNQVTQEEAIALITAYGADAARWPVEHRAALLALIAADPQVAAAHAEAAEMDALLAGWAKDVPSRSFDADALVPMALRPARFKAVRWLGAPFLGAPLLGAGAVAASVAVALLLGVPGTQTMSPPSTTQIAQNTMQLESASAQAEPLDGFALIFTPTAYEEDLI